jgi:Protein of unknown function (DUF5818)
LACGDLRRSVIEDLVSKPIVYGGTKSMKARMGVLSTLALLAVLLPNLLAQGNQPSRQEDPTAQAPATRAPATPPTFPTSEAKKKQSDRPDVRVYMGTIVQNGDSYVLKAGNEQYLLESQKNVQKYKGKDVKITGTLDKAKNLIHVEKINVSPSM